MNSHDYGPEEFDHYSQDPEWRALEQIAYPDYDLPPYSNEPVETREDGLDKSEDQPEDGEDQPEDGGDQPDDDLQTEEADQPPQ